MSEREVLELDVLFVGVRAGRLVTIERGGIREIAMTRIHIRETL